MPSIVEPIVFGIVLGLVANTAFGLLIIAGCHWLGLARLAVLGLPVAAPSYVSTTLPVFGVALADEPRSASGKFVCSNCHLLSARVELSLPQAVFQESSFDIWSRVPTRRTNAQVRSDGTVGPLQMGRVLVFPTGSISPMEEWSQWQSNRSALWIGPLASKEHAIEASSFTVNDIVPGTYTVYLGANRGRGQLYPSGLASNIAPVRSAVNGLVAGLTFQAKRYGTNLWMHPSDGSQHLLHAPSGIVVLRSVFPRSFQRSENSLAHFRNLGGFGVAEGSLTFQTSQRLLGELRVLALLSGTQVALVLKKKQFERLNL